MQTIVTTTTMVFIILETSSLKFDSISYKITFIVIGFTSQIGPYVIICHYTCFGLLMPRWYIIGSKAKWSYKDLLDLGE